MAENKTLTGYAVVQMGSKDMDFINVMGNCYALGELDGGKEGLANALSVASDHYLQDDRYPIGVYRVTLERVAEIG